MSARDDYPGHNRNGDQWLAMCDEIDRWRADYDRCAEINDRLRQWKAEAMQVLGDWEAVWETAGRPGPLGFSKAAAVQALIADLRATADNVRAAFAPDEAIEDET